MMQINDRFSCAVSWMPFLLASPGGEAVEPQQIAILGEDDMFLVSVSIDAAELSEISGNKDTISSFLFFRVMLWPARSEVEEDP